MKLLKNFLNLFYKDIKKIEESIKGSKFIFDSIDILYYDLNKISLKRGETYIDPPKWIKSIKNNLERISKIKPFIDQYSWI